MKIFTSSQVRNIDQYTISNEPVGSIDLMERASNAFVGKFTQHYKNSIPVKIFAGPGNNGGDALAITRLLLERNYDVHCYLLNLNDKYSSDCEINLTRLQSAFPERISELSSKHKIPDLERNAIIIDGIFGSGLARPVEGYAAEIIKSINSSSGIVVSIDIPSGLFGEDNTERNMDNVIRAHQTLTFQFPFLSFFFAENYKYTGEWEILDIGLHPEAIRITPTNYYTIDLSEIKTIIRKREKYTHKGSYGHALIIGGSYGMMGAEVLAVKACLRGGAGLVTAHVPRYGYEIIQVTAPEALVSIDESDIIFSDYPALTDFSAIAAGPGLGCKNNSCKGLKRLLEEARVPLVLDADALNILSKNPDWLNLLPVNSILTPHPGEFDRLAGKSSSMYERYMKQLELSSRYNVHIILKGAHSILVTSEGDTWFNTSGNPGMATGGSGDVLTGLLVSLLAQGYTNVEACKAGIFIHGLAGDLAVEEMGENALIASDIIEFMGKAFCRVGEESREKRA